MKSLAEVLLQDRGQVVGFTSSGEVSVRLCEIFRPDVLLVSEFLVDGLIDVYLPRLVQSGTRIGLLTDQHPDVNRLLTLVEQGITGFANMQAAPHEITEMILALAEGSTVLPSDLVTTIVSEWRIARRTGTRTSKALDLTVREMEILGAMVDGLPNKAIAHLLGVSIKTIEHHKTRIYMKLQVGSQAEAVGAVLDGRCVLSRADPQPAQTLHRAR